MLKYLLIFFACYLLVRFIFGFVIPVLKAGITVRKKMKEMHSQMEGYQNTETSSSSINTSEGRKSSAKASSSDYIDFEEIK